jgi:hypothetical protein
MRDPGSQLAALVSPTGPSSVQHDRLFYSGPNGPLTCGGLHERLSLEGGEPANGGGAGSVSAPVLAAC